MTPQNVLLKYPSKSFFFSGYYIIAFTATAIVNESVSAEENPSDGELFKDADLQEAYNKLCKVAAKDVMNVELGLKKIASLEIDKRRICLLNCLMLMIF